MHLCRSALQRLAPLTRRGNTALLRHAPVRHMSASSVPGSSGDSLQYYLLVGVACAGAGVYVYRTLSRDKDRLHERHEYVETKIKPLTGSADDKTSETVEVQEVSEALVKAVEAAIEEAAVEEVTEQEEVLTTSAAPVTEEAALPAVEELVIAEVSTEQVEQEKVEPAAEDTPAEASPVLETSSDSIPEELASAAADDWSELSARKPEESLEESPAAGQDGEEAVQSEEASASS